MQFHRRQIELERRQIVRCTLLDFAPQPCQRRQSGLDAGPDDQAHGHHQQRQGQQRIGQNRTRQFLLVGAAAGYLHQHGLIRFGHATIRYIQRGDTHGFALAVITGDFAVVKIRRIEFMAGRAGWRGQLVIAKDEAAGRRADGVHHAVLRIGFEDFLCGAGEVDQQALFDRLDLP